MNWLSHIGKQASRLASLELFRYIGPGLLRHGRLHRSGQLGHQRGGRFPVRLQAALGRDPLDDHPDHRPAQRRPPGDRHRPVPVRGGLQILQTLAAGHDAGERHGGLRLHRPGRTAGRRHRPEHADRPAADGRCRAGGRRSRSGCSSPRTTSAWKNGSWASSP